MSLKQTSASIIELHLCCCTSAALLSLEHCLQATPILSWHVRDSAQLLLQAALRYGVAMLRRAGGGLRPHVHVDNAYERRLLAGTRLAGGV